MEQKLPKPEELITGTTGNLSDLHGQALTKGLIPNDMSREEFIDKTRGGRENPPRSSKHLPSDLVEERKTSKRNVKNIFQKDP